MLFPPVTVRLSNTLLESTLRHVFPQTGICCSVENHFQNIPIGPLTKPILITHQLLPTDPPESTILLLDDHHPEWPVSEGIAGILCHSCDFTELVHCVKIVLNGGRYVAPKLIPLVLSRTCSLPPPPGPCPDLSILSSREREVFKLFQQGRTIPEIADALCISPHTAEGHRARIQRKLNLKGAHCLLRFATALPSG